MTEAYEGVGNQIRHAKPLPAFTEVRSSLVLEERELATMASRGSGSAMVVAVDEDALPYEREFEQSQR